MDLAPALAARLDAGMLSDCVGAVPGPEGILWERHAFGGSAVSFVRFREEKTPIISVRPGSFGGKAGAGEQCLRGPAEAAAVPVTRFGYQPDRVIARPSLIRVLESAREQGTDIGSADVIVAGGNGAGPEGFALIRELAGLLHGAVGASRIAVDKGWAPHSQLIGQSADLQCFRLRDCRRSAPCSAGTDKGNPQQQGMSACLTGVRRTGWGNCKFAQKEKNSLCYLTKQLKV